MLNPKPVRGGEVAIACGGCRACCHQAVLLDPSETGYDEVVIPTLEGAARFLRRREDGSCIYLVEGNCSIYAARPACCRMFDCGAWYRWVKATRPKLLDDMRRSGDAQDRRLVKEGRRRA